MALKRIMGTETEYGITGGQAHTVVRAYKGKKKKSHDNFGKTNESVVNGLTDVGGHIGGDYGTLEEQVKGVCNQQVLPGFSRAGFDPYNVNRQPQHLNVSHRRVKAHTPRIQTYTSILDPDDIIDNGSRFYIDMGHPELSTAETSNPRDLVIYDKAGELIVLRAAKKAGKNIKIYKNNSDGQGNSYGCHENYLMQRYSSKDFKKIVVPALVPFFVTRQIFTGSGKIGIEHARAYCGVYGGVNSVVDQDNENKVSPGWKAYQEQKEKTLEELEDLSKHFLDIPEYSDVEKLVKKLISKREQLGEQQVYQLSQRADFFKTLVGLQTTHNRPIVNTRDEPHADSEKYMRLHVINGDANLSEVATYLKTGTTDLVLDLMEDGLVPSISIKNPVKQIQRISLDQSRKWNVELKNSKTMPAVDIQRMYLDAAIKAYKGRDEITDDVLKRWEHTLNTLEKNPMKLATSIDWVAKLNLLTHLMDKKGLGLNDDIIRNAALQYHDIDRETGLFYYLQNNGLVERIVSDNEIEHAVYNPPEDTRAYLRSRVGEIDDVTDVDWGGFEVKVGKRTMIVDIKEPFSGTKKAVGNLIDNYTSAEEFVEELKKLDGIDVRKQRCYARRKIHGVTHPSLLQHDYDDEWYNRYRDW